MVTNDFEFNLGKGRQLKGRGLAGIVALSLFLGTVIAVSATLSPTALGAVEAAISQLSSATKKLF